MPSNQALSLEALISSGMLSMDVEFGNAHGFYSGAKQDPLRYPGIKLPSGQEWVGKINEAVQLTLRDSVKLVTSHEVTRHLMFRAERPVQLFDLVSRFVVHDQSERPAYINGQAFQHTCANLYRQFPAHSVRVPIGQQGWLSFQGEVTGMPSPGFEHVFYIRDESRNGNANRWIVHHRIMATLYAPRLVLRGCNPRFEGPAPDWLNQLVPRWLHASFYRIRERRYPGFPIMTVAESPLQPGEDIIMATHLTSHD